MVRNELLRSARERLASPRRPGESMSRSEVATAVNEILYSDPQLRRRSAFNANYLGKLEEGVIHWPKPEYRAALRTILAVDRDEELGFYNPRTTARDNVENVDRRELLGTLGTLISAGMAGPPITALPGAEEPGELPRQVGREHIEQVSETASIFEHWDNSHGGAVDRKTVDDGPGEWLAWALWQRRAHELAASLVPSDRAPLLKTHPHVIFDPEGCYRFTDPALIDALVAQRIFRDVHAGSNYLLATAQTSHTMDTTLSALIGADKTAWRSLSRWMSRGVTPVLRVNAAGVLAKTGIADLGDSVISTLRVDQDVRQLYLTAVASRVLHMPWQQAASIAAWTDKPAAVLMGRYPDGQDAQTTQRLTAEISRSRDAAARWCCTVLLSATTHQAPGGVRNAIARAVQDEPCRENLRAYAAVLADANTIG